MIHRKIILKKRLFQLPSLFGSQQVWLRAVNYQTWVCNISGKKWRAFFSIHSPIPFTNLTRTLKVLLENSTNHYMQGNLLQMNQCFNCKCWIVQVSHKSSVKQTFDLILQSFRVFQWRLQPNNEGLSLFLLLTHDGLQQ